MRLQFEFLCQQRKCVSRSSPFLTTILFSYLPHLLQLGLASFLNGIFMIAVLHYFVIFALTGGYILRGVLGRIHVRMYLPFSHCLMLGPHWVRCTTKGVHTASQTKATAIYVLSELRCSCPHRKDLRSHHEGTYMPSGV